MSAPTLADQLIDVLRQAGVERVYGVVGDSLNPVVDAIRRADGIEWVHVRSELARANLRNIPRSPGAASPRR